ncbi:MAG TPA: ABC transporter ATP-binding protein [Chitinispirillaceae bacterium]|nr:ABC transporter ATP-binding protein [Chitinispirillaceae bacterium]
MVSNKDSIHFILKYFKKHRYALAAGILVLVGVDTLQFIIPGIIQKVLDTLSSGNAADHFIIQSVLIIFAAAIVMFGLRFLWRIFIIMPSRSIERDIRNDMFNHLLTLSASYFNKTRTGNLMSLFTSDLTSIRMASGIAIVGLIDALFLSTMSLIFMLMIDIRLTLITVLPLPMIIFVLVYSGKRIQKAHLAVQESYDAISSHAQESYSGIRVLKGFCKESSEHARFQELCITYMNNNVAMVKIWGLLFPTIGFLASLSISLLLFSGGRLVLSDQLTFGKFVAFSFYINLFAWPMVAVGWIYNIFQRGIASTKRVLELFSEKPDIHVHPVSTETFDAVSGDITFDNLTFRYSENAPDIIKKFSIHIPSGGSLGIIGKPGSGKTTLISLLFHLYPLPEKSLFIDNRDINEISVPLLRSSISFVPQDSFLFSDTIRENIGFGAKTTVSNEEIEHVAKIASVHDDILKFKNGYNSVVGERGIALSGGQKQRIALARALLSQAPILILDDALSAVDASTERIIQRNLKMLLNKRTVIIVAHRISTIRLCNEIIVLSDGGITEQGTHDQLVANDGFYSRVYNLQHGKTS